MNAQGGLILLWLALCHLAGTYLFFRGFLLTHRRLSDPEPCNEAYCTLPAAYERIVLLVVDSLRFDFITPNPPEPAAIYHDVLKLPGELSEMESEHSLLFSAYADPPTTTLQRIKGITAGSIPSFIDLGSTFGFTAGQSWLDGLRSAGKRIAFMGDDTWLSTFSSVFTPDMSWPYDSFNIEDFDTVDNGIMSHLLPLLRAETKSWDAIVAHFLGIDHVGHRVGPEHPAMRTKLAHMDSMLREIVALLDDQTLLVLLGDHGMDRRGNHGCDSVDEVTVGVWLYSKGRRLQHPAAAIPSFLRLNATYPGATASHRAIQQIDLAPSIALLLGLPIPPSNLGSVIPEIFWHDPTGATFDRALRLNTEQVHRYLAAQYAGFSGTEVEKGWPQLQDLRHRASARCSDAANHKCVASWASLFEYLNTALLLCRRSWPYFDPKLIIMGFLVLACSALASWTSWSHLHSLGDDWEVWAMKQHPRAMRAAGIGVMLALVASPFWRQVLQNVDILHFSLFTASLLVPLAVIASSLPSSPRKALRHFNPTGIPILLVVHTASFASSILVIWEDRFITFLLLSTLVVPVLTGVCAPTSRLRARILGSAAVFAICIRLMAASTVCREDQHPQCTISFFASESLTAPPRLVRVLAPLTAVIIPYCIHSVLGISQLNEGPSTLFLRWLMPAALTQACAAWTLEWIEVADITPARTAWLRPLRTLLSSGAFGMVLMMSYTLRQTSPSGPKIGTSWNAGEGRGKRVLSRSTPNALAAPYFLLWCIPFCTVYVVNQLSAQVVLGVSAIALIAYVELLVGMRTARGLHSPLDSSVPSSALLPDMPRDVYSPIVFSDIIPLALLAQHTFYATGHQVTISSVQWKTAFVLTPTLNLLISPVTLVINECSPWFLAAFAVPLVALWKRCPTSNAAATGAIRRECIRAAIGMMFYHNILLLSSAATSFWLRQHPMAWKVFVPRLIVAALTVVVVDVALLLGVQLAIMQLPDRAPRGFVPSSKNNS